MRVSVFSSLLVVDNDKCAYYKGIKYSDLKWSNKTLQKAVISYM
jgi:hypothetical protein